VDQQRTQDLWNKIIITIFRVCKCANPPIIHTDFGYYLFKSSLLLVVSDGSGRRHRITVIMESRRNGPQLSSRHDDDDDDAVGYHYQLFIFKPNYSSTLPLGCIHKLPDRLPKF